MTIKLALVDLGPSREEINEPIGLEVLAGVIRRKFGGAVSVNLFSTQVHSQDTYLYNLLEYDMVGVSSQIGSAASIHKLMGEIYQSGKAKQRPLVLLGNVLPTFAFEHFLSIYQDVICIRGEGEDALVGVLECLSQQNNTSIFEIKRCLLKANVPNLAMMANGELVLTPRRTTNIADMALPARDLLSDIIAYNGIVRIEGSRGCPWGKCSFCTISARYGNSYWRPFPVHRIIQDLEVISDHGGMRPYFTDEDFIGSDYSRALEIAKQISNAKKTGRINPDLSFFFSTSVNSISRIADHKKISELFSCLHGAGLREVFLGIESGSPAQLKRYRKGVSQDKNAEIFMLLRETGLDLDAGFIMFDPLMTLDELSENMGFIRDIRLDTVDSRLTKPMIVFPETALSGQLQQNKIVEKNLDNNFLTYSYQFVDSLVQIVFDAFRLWELEKEKEVYALQGRMRGEVSTEESRTRDRSLLVQLREIDLFFIESSIAAIKANGNLSLEILRNLVDEKDHLTTRRNLLIQKANISTKE